MSSGKFFILINCLEHINEVEDGREWKQSKLTLK